jgi:hypothetical protein
MEIVNSWLRQWKRQNWNSRTNSCHWWGHFPVGLCSQTYFFPDSRSGCPNFHSNVSVLRFPKKSNPKNFCRFRNIWQWTKQHLSNKVRSRKGGSCRKRTKFEKSKAGHESSKAENLLKKSKHLEDVIRWDFFQFARAAKWKGEPDLVGSLIGTSRERAYASSPTNFVKRRKPHCHCRRRGNCF